MLTLLALGRVGDLDARLCAPTVTSACFLACGGDDSFCILLVGPVPVAVDPIAPVPMPNDVEQSLLEKPSTAWSPRLSINCPTVCPSKVRPSRELAVPEFLAECIAAEWCKLESMGLKN